ncbi:MAG: DUF362 domain-containing protein, partial [Candidatus Bathyarchaeia archaeon]
MYKMKSVVVIFKGSDPVEVTFKALEAIREKLDFLPDKKQILIKPNYITAHHPLTGVTTDGRVIEGIIRFLKEHGRNDIVVGEGSGLTDTFEAFKIAGLEKLGERWNVKLMDLNKDVFVE